LGIVYYGKKINLNTKIKKIGEKNMNWTRVKDASKVVRKLFLKEVVPTSKELRKKGTKFFPTQS